MAVHKPERVVDLMAYMASIAKASQKYRWPSWVIYDQNFRQEAVGGGWAKVDPSMYAQCFTGQAISPENWCSRCQCLDHTSAQCPFKPRKRPWAAAFEGATAPSGRKPEQSTCLKYNKYNGDCKDCRFAHVCSNCREPHPATRCSAGGRGARTAGTGHV